MLSEKDCVEFLDNQTIGFDPQGQIKRTIQVEILPCMENCYVHNFVSPPLAIGMQEIKPQNALPYQAFMHRFLQNYGHLVSYINTAANYQDYEKPIS